METGNKPAFPFFQKTELFAREDGSCGINEETQHAGMTIRQLIAKDMAAAIASQIYSSEAAMNIYLVNDNRAHAAKIAEDALAIADAVIAELDKK